MRQIYVIILFHFLGLITIYGQDTITIVNIANNLIEKDNHTPFVRKLYFKDKLWHVKDSYTNGNSKMTGSYRDKKCTKKQGDFVYYFVNGKKDSEGKYERNKYSGEWNWYFENGQLSARETYIKDLKIKAEFWDSTGMKTDSAKAEHMAQFQNGDLSAFSNWVIGKVKYPDEAVESSISGTVYVQFTVNTNGSVTDIKLLRGVDTLLNNEAIKAVQSSPKWNPAKQHNRFVNQVFILPVKFKLN